MSGARDRAELVTDDATEIRAQLEAVTGKRIAQLEGIGEMERASLEKAAETQLEGGRRRERGAGPDAARDRDGPVAPSKDREMPAPERGKGAGMELGL